ncbi:hypothetical protein, partial [Streptomyces sp. JJ36]|uniref:hypothetical protein n=1 Tax=Streptomyces sp. JJ36 TaxID=2736645 RepID=UPI0023513420
MVRNLIGSLLALVGAAAAVWSVFRDWYGGREGQDFLLEDLFTPGGVSGSEAALFTGLFLPMAVAALVVVVGVLLRSQLMVALGGLLVLGFAVLWMVRLGMDLGSLTVGGDTGLASGVGIAVGGGLAVLVGAVVMRGRRKRRGRHRLETEEPVERRGFGWSRGRRHGGPATAMTAAGGAAGGTAATHAGRGGAAPEPAPEPAEHAGPGVTEPATGTAYSGTAPGPQGDRPTGRGEDTRRTGAGSTSPAAPRAEEPWTDRAGAGASAGAGAAGPPGEPGEPAEPAAPERAAAEEQR